MGNTIMDEEVKKVEEEIKQENLDSGKTEEQLDNLDGAKADEAIKTTETAEEKKPEEKTAEEITEPKVMPNDADLDELEKALEASKTAATKKKEIEVDTPDNDKKPEEKVSIPSNDAAEPDKTGEDKTKATVRIDEAYIKTQPTEVQEILQGLKGKLDFVDLPKPFHDRFIKNYVESQKYIAQLKAERELVPTKPDVTNIETSADDKTYITDLVHQKMKEKYHGLGDTPEEIKQFESDLSIDDARKFNQYLADERELRSKAETEVKQKLYMKQHQNEFAIKAASKANELFVTELQKHGIKNPDVLLKEKNIDFSTFDDTGKNQQLNDLIWDPEIPLEVPIRKFGGNGDPNDFNDKEAIYLIDPVKLYMRASYKYGSVLNAADKDRIAKEAFERGLKKEAAKDGYVPPSASASSGSSALQIKAKSGPIVISEEQSVEEMETNLEKLKAQIIKKVASRNQ